MSGSRWLSILVATAAAGWASGEWTGAHELADSPVYQSIVTVLLAVGLYGSTSGISLVMARQELRVIVFAITVGVAVKAALITGAMYTLVDHSYAILGLVVAQIDPLSVAAMLGRSGMSERAKTILQAWSSFDDPITTLLTIYALTWIASDAGGNTLVSDSGLLNYAGGLGENLLFAGAAYLLWWVLNHLLRSGSRWLPSTPRAAEIVRQALLITALLVLMTLAISRVLMLGVAIAGLFFRPALDRVLPQVLQGALIAATFALGLLLTAGVSLGAGCALAAFAVLAQVIATWILPTRLTIADRHSLALGQQNGITAIILALAIEPVLPGTVAIVAPAILFINVFHLASNEALTWLLNRSVLADPPPELNGSPRPAADKPSTGLPDQAS